MKEITVYADFDFLAAPQEIGTLGYERIRGNDHFSFRYSTGWLKSNGGIILSGDLMNVTSQQHPRVGGNVFGFIKDSFPDRWGRLLLDRRERILAKGWTLSPAYDINPDTKKHQCLLIDQYTEESDINALLNACESYMLERKEAGEIIEEVRTAIRDWRTTAASLHIPVKVLDPYFRRWDSC